MRLVYLFAVVVALAVQGCDERDLCSDEGILLDAYTGCEGKSCGEPCQRCPPPPCSPDCVESTVPLECDASGFCVAVPAEQKCEVPPSGLTTPQ